MEKSLFIGLFILCSSALADNTANCTSEPTQVIETLKGAKAEKLFDSIKATDYNQQIGQDLLGRIWFTGKEQRTTLRECSVNDCTYTRYRINRCVKAFNGRTDCTTLDQTLSYCADPRS